MNDKRPLDNPEFDPFGSAGDGPKSEHPSLHPDLTPRVLFPLNACNRETATDRHETAALKVLEFLNDFERSTVGYQTQGEVDSLRVELLAELLRKEFGK